MPLTMTPEREQQHRQAIDQPEPQNVGSKLQLAACALWGELEATRARVRGLAAEARVRADALEELERQSDRADRAERALAKLQGGGAREVTE